MGESSLHIYRTETNDELEIQRYKREDTSSRDPPKEKRGHIIEGQQRGSVKRSQREQDVSTIKDYK